MWPFFLYKTFETRNFEVWFQSILFGCQTVNELLLRIRQGMNNSFQVGFQRRLEVRAPEPLA